MGWFSGTQNTAGGSRSLFEVELEAVVGKFINNPLATTDISKEQLPVIQYLVQRHIAV